MKFKDIGAHMNEQIDSHVQLAVARFGAADAEVRRLSDIAKSKEQQLQTLTRKYESSDQARIDR